jgi:hypothetical protein
MPKLKMINPEEICHYVEDSRRIQSCHERQIVPGSVRETTDRPRLVGDRLVSHGEDSPTSADRDDDVAD